MNTEGAQPAEPDGHCGSAGLKTSSNAADVAGFEEAVSGPEQARTEGAHGLLPATNAGSANPHVDATDFDVAVVGNGPGGVAYAAHLAAAGRSVALIGVGTTRRAGTLELLSGRNRSALAELGVLDAVRARAARY